MACGRLMTFPKLMHNEVEQFGLAQVKISLAVFFHLHTSRVKS